MYICNDDFLQVELFVEKNRRVLGPTNQILKKFPKCLNKRIRWRAHKTLDTRVIYSPMSPRFAFTDVVILVYIDVTLS